MRAYIIQRLQEVFLQALWYRLNEAVTWLSGITRFAGVYLLLLSVKLVDIMNCL